MSCRNITQHTHVRKVKSRPDATLRIKRREYMDQDFQKLCSHET